MRTPYAGWMNSFVEMYCLRSDLIAFSGGDLKEQQTLKVVRV